MYAVVDIETTGGHPSEAGITEICVVVTNGKEVQQVYETLLNPGVYVPRHITALTGIHNNMLESAPAFAGIAGELYHLLHDKVFVAHNVNFDYGFIQAAFAKCGLKFSTEKLCSVKLARKAFPGRNSYSLGNICASLGIEIGNRHRAGGDAQATAVLFHRCVELLGKEHISNLAARSLNKIVLPPAIEQDCIDKIPDTAGVYFFRDKTGKPLYIGKANSLRKRVLQHFNVQRGKTALQLEQIHNIDFEECGNELVAFLREAEAIHTYWPPWNVKGKNPSNKYAIVHYQTQGGLLRIQTEKRSKNSLSGKSYPRLSDARSTLGKALIQHGLCPVLIRTEGQCKVPGCYCIEERVSMVAEHNSRAIQALQSLEEQNESFLISGPGRSVGEQTLVLIRNGSVTGWGFADEITDIRELDDIISTKPDIPETRDIASAFVRSIQEIRGSRYKLIPLNNLNTKEYEYLSERESETA
jgi:DNA polymerase-3 subunit epsilon